MNTPPLQPDEELRKQVAGLKLASTPENIKRYGEFTLGDFLHPTQIEQLVQLVQAREQAARIDGASIAADQINKEIGLELTTNGQYYLNRKA